MSLFGRRKGGKSREVTPEAKAEVIATLIPEETGNRAVSIALEKLGISMSAGEIRDAVVELCGALIVQREHPGDEDKLELAQAVIDGRRKNLGLHLQTLELTAGDPEEAADMDLKTIRVAVDQAYSQNGAQAATA